MPYNEITLAASDDMEPVAGTVDVSIPADVLWDSFRHANLWPRWNRCFFWVHNRDLVRGRQLIWCFQPIRWWMLYKMPAIAKIVEMDPGKKVTWQVTALPGFYARHTYHVEDLGNGRSRFGSWEKAQGWSFRLMKWFWVPHFVFVKDRSLEGARRLEAVYRERGALGEKTIPPRRGPVARWMLRTVALVVIAAVIAAGWFYFRYVRQEHVQLTPSVWASLNGGGNSLIVDGGDSMLLVDTKFWPGSTSLSRWLRTRFHQPVTHVVNTHYHYDHTYGNPLYPDAARFAYRTVPQLMQRSETNRVYWAQHPAGVPNRSVGDAPEVLHIGATYVVLRHVATAAHTHGDLVVILPQENIVATGDLLFNTYYPFFDLDTEGGAFIPGQIGALRALAAEFPNARFVPGHGPIATARDVLDYADFLQALQDAVTRAVGQGLSENDAVRTIDLSSRKRSVLPSFPEGVIPEWATQDRTVRFAYRLAKGAQASADVPAEMNARKRDQPP
jgi:cyclase